MTAGLRVIGALGTAQIDSNYRNFELIAAGSITLTGGSGVVRYADVAIPSGEAFPVLALASGYPCWSVMASASVYRIYATVPNNVVPTLQYYMFGTPAPVPSGPSGIIGLRVRNPATGNIAFSSERRYMNVLDRRSGAMALSDAVSGSVAGKTVAIAVQMRPYNWNRRTVNQGQPVTQISIRSGRAVTSGSSWTYDFNATGIISASLGTTPTLDYTLPYYALLIIDVTGY